MPSHRRRIFEAIQRGDPWQHVALAVYAPGDGELATMAEAARRLDHPGIARLVAVHGDAIALAWAGGQRLDRALDTASPDERLELAIQIAELVGHAHDRGVVLRDLKPGNLLLDRSDGKFHVTLVDLDLARVESSPAPGLGATGTWGWSAPEQAVLEPSAIDLRADLYGLGTTLAFVFTGAPLFSRGPIAVREQLLEDRLAEAALAEPVRAIVSQLVAVDREARRPAIEIVAALRVLRGEHVSGPRPPRSRGDRGSGDAAYAAFRAAVAATAQPPAGTDDDRLAVARTCLRLADRDGARRHAHAVRDGHGDLPAALAILARADLEDGRRSDAVAVLDRVTALPAAPEAARDVLAAEVTALRPRRALELARCAGDPALRAVRELASAWLAELDELAWHQQLAWHITRPDGAAIIDAMADAVVQAGGEPPARAYAALARPDPDAQLDHRVAAAALAGADELTGAIGASMLAVVHEPRNPAAWIQCADLLIADARAVDALDVLTSCDRVCGAGPDAERLRATAWLALDELDLAVAAGQRALAGGRDAPALWQILALAWIGLGNGNDALNAVRMLARTGDSDARAPRLACYAALASDELADQRERFTEAALAASPADPDLALIRGLAQLGAGARSPAERTLAALRTLHPDLAPLRSARLAIRGMTAALAGAIQACFASDGSPVLDWAAGLYFLATGHPIMAASFLRDRAGDTAGLAAEAFVRSGDRDALRSLVHGLTERGDVADQVARRLRHAGTG